MNVSFLLKQYFADASDASIDAFDAYSLTDVCQQVIHSISVHFENEEVLFQSLSSCLYNLIDNVNAHSEKPLGVVITYFDTSRNVLRLLVADDGMEYDLYATSRLIQNVGLQFIILSGNHKLFFKDGRTEIVENGLWQGTIVYMEISTSKDIDPNEIIICFQK